MSDTPYVNSDRHDCTLSKLVYSIWYAYGIDVLYSLGPGSNVQYVISCHADVMSPFK